jgi:polyphosphate kinase 2 (PPK2 family)
VSKKSSGSLSTELDPFISPFRIDGTGKFHLRSHKTDAKGGLDKAEGEKMLDANRKRLADFQEKLFAQDRWSVLVVLQGMDAAGKDSAIKGIFEGVNPQGCEVTSFKQPSTLELNHDFMWRCVIALPKRGHIGIFNRSYYEEVLIVRVHRQILSNEDLPQELVDKKHFWRDRYRSIQNLEGHLHRNGTRVIKFFLHLS